MNTSTVLIWDKMGDKISDIYRSIDEILSLVKDIRVSQVSYDNPNILAITFNKEFTEDIIGLLYKIQNKYRFFFSVINSSF